jgi:hypothetical protein
MHAGRPESMSDLPRDEPRESARRHGENDMNKPTVHRLSFPGAILARGFWLCIWRIVTDEGQEYLHAGRTGDSSSRNAQSPFARVSQHLGSNEHANTLRRHLEDNGIEPESCGLFDLFAYGPIFQEATTDKTHKSRRDRVAGLERSLCDELRFAGYTVLNKVECRKPLDQKIWRTLRRAFATHFERLDKAAPIRETSAKLQL